MLAALVVAVAVAGDATSADAAGAGRIVSRYEQMRCPTTQAHVRPGDSVIPAEDEDATAAVIEGAVPRLTIIRVIDGRDIVSTNTEDAPDPTDNFYVVTGGHARPASTRLRGQVLSACR